MHLLLPFLWLTFIQVYLALFLLDIPCKANILWCIHGKVSLSRCERLRNENIYTLKMLSVGTCVIVENEINWKTVFIVTGFRYPVCILTFLYRVFWGWVGGKLTNKLSWWWHSVSFRKHWCIYIWYQHY